MKYQLLLCVKYTQKSIKGKLLYALYKIPYTYCGEKNEKKIFGYYLSL